jgi:hypothetical protein
MIEDISINFMSRYVYREHTGYDHIYLQTIGKDVYWFICTFFLVCIYFHLIDNAFEIFYNLKSKLIDFIVFFIIMFNI